METFNIDSASPWTPSHFVPLVVCPDLSLSRLSSQIKFNYQSFVDSLSLQRNNPSKDRHSYLPTNENLREVQRPSCSLSSYSRSHQQHNLLKSANVPVHIFDIDNLPYQKDGCHIRKNYVSTGIQSLLGYSGAIENCSVIVIQLL